MHPKGNDIYKVSVKKTAVSLRIDNEVLAALKATGKGYQSRINNEKQFLDKNHITHIRPQVVNTNSKKIQLRTVFLEKTVFLVRKK